MPITDQDDKFFYTDKGGRVAKSALSDEKRLGYEQELAASQFSSLAKQPGALPEEASPFPAGAPNMTLVPQGGANAAPYMDTIQAPQGGSVWDQPAQMRLTSANQLGAPPPQQQVSLGGVMDLSQYNQYGQAPMVSPEEEKILKTAERGLVMQQNARRELAVEQGKKNLETAKILDDLRKQTDIIQYDRMRIAEARQNAVADATMKIQEAEKAFTDYKVTPDNFFGNDTGRKVLAGIGIMFGAIGAAMTGSKTNRALQIINDAIDRDIKAQESRRDQLAKAVTQKQKALEVIKANFEDKEDYQLAQKEAALGMAELKIKEVAARYGTPQAMAQAQDAIGQLEMKRAELRSRILERAESRVAADMASQAKAVSEDPRLVVPKVGVAMTEADAKDVKTGVEAKNSLIRKIDEMIDLREKHGGGELFNRTDVKRAQQLSKDALLQYKNMAKLGVLSQTDKDIVDAIIPDDPLEFRDVFSAIFGDDPTLNKLKKFKLDVLQDFKTTLGTRMRQVDPAVISEIDSQLGVTKDKETAASTQRSKYDMNRPMTGGR